MKSYVTEKNKAATLPLLVLLMLLPCFACKDGNTLTSVKNVPPPNATLTPNTTPTPNATPTPPADVSHWDLTDRVVGDTGPDFCIWTAKVGMAFQGTYTVTRYGNSVSFTPADIVDWESYSGTLTGLTFSASNPASDSGPAMCTHYVQADSLTGSFSPDGKSLSATEVWTFTLDSGQVKTLTFQWTATRRTS